ncbi:MAG: hypothetical protein KR126chlam4_01404 [Candidatus Anoxychlamydiales bacterium]|nr:hypothetical protein [Candidatus Anoxychlamydiales bacterium]NGX41562.1 hypothetical protein [Candidatus Anoxychlamydiales bacterium]
MCHGISIEVKNEIGFNYDSILALLKRLLNYQNIKPKSKILALLTKLLGFHVKEKKVNEKKEGSKTIVQFSNSEIEIIKKATNQVLKNIDEYQFQTRIGISIEEAKKIVKIFTTTEITERTLPFWVIFPKINPPDYKWVEPALYPIHEWIDFVWKKTSEEREKYFLNWRAPENWQDFFTESWQRMLYPEKFKDD